MGSRVDVRLRFESIHKINIDEIFSDTWVMKRWKEIISQRKAIFEIPTAVSENESFRFKR